MFTLLEVKFDLLAINYLQDHPAQLRLMPHLLDELEDDLWGSGITSVSLPSISKSYTVLYGTSGNDTINVLASYPLDGFNPFLPFPPDINGNNFSSAWFNNHILVGGKGNDQLTGGLGDDIILGGAGIDILQGMDGINTLWGDDGNDKIYGNSISSVFNVPDLSFFPNATLPFVSVLPSAYLYGGQGDDLLVGLFGLAGLSASNGIVQLEVGADFRFFSGGDGNDRMVGECEWASINLVNIHGTNQTSDGPGINGLGGWTMYGGSGNDYMTDGFFQHNFNLTNNTGEIHNIAQDSLLYGESGNDTMIGSFSACTDVIIQGGSLTMKSYGANSLLNGGSGDDLLIGDMQALSAQRDNSWTGEYNEYFGNSTLIGGSGKDTLIGDIQYNGYHFVVDANGIPILDLNCNPTIVLGSLDAVITHGGDNILFGGQGNDTLTGGNLNGPAADFLGQNKFVYDGCINNGKDVITDFNIANDTLVGQNGATFCDGGLVSGNRVVLVDDAGWNSTITLVGVTDNFASIMQTHAVIV